MQKIRFGVFETNSSNTHSLTIVPKEVFYKWCRGELYFDNYDKIIVSEEEAKRRYEGGDKSWNKTFEEYKKKYLLTRSDWFHWNVDLEYFETDYKTPGGEELVAFGKYGYDG
jgi:hypothetical protein